ncbi:hypothetical protein O6H91_20G021600 [Diphasiastrum complanatum]|uniref:Uncharacterized protein n=1 Tax=Diphasiastrum complanatum TaxID=34168 RepID=A0ACC2ANJ1_DIPCM|nr:hypothetical protein O6H91_20G021600 [Diphasiastrum complanatum]
MSEVVQVDTILPTSGFKHYLVLINFFSNACEEKPFRNRRHKWPSDCTCINRNEGLEMFQCRNVVWLPGAILEAAVTTEVCSSCRPGPVFKIRFKFRRAEIPLQYSSDYTGCVGGCDDILKDIINVCGSGGGARGPRGSGNGNLNRVRTCPTCGNSGHQPCECTLRRTQLPQTPDHQPNNLARSPGETCNCPLSRSLYVANSQYRG